MCGPTARRWYMARGSVSLMKKQKRAGSHAVCLFLTLKIMVFLHLGLS